MKKRMKELVDNEVFYFYDGRYRFIQYSKKIDEDITVIATIDLKTELPYFFYNMENEFIEVVNSIKEFTDIQLAHIYNICNFERKRIELCMNISDNDEYKADEYIKDLDDILDKTKIYGK